MSQCHTPSQCLIVPALFSRLTSLVNPFPLAQFPKPHFPLESGGGMGYTHFHLAHKGEMTDCSCQRFALVATAQNIQRYEIDSETD